MATAKSRVTPVAKVAAARSRTRLTGTWQMLSHGNFTQVLAMPPLERAELVKKGAPSSVVYHISREMDVPKERFVRMAGFSKATVNRKIARNHALSADDSERLVAIAKLIGQVETMVRESGDPKGFKPAKWFGQWVAQPHPALGGRAPEELLDTVDGRDTVSKLLAQMQSGAYA